MCWSVLGAWQIPVIKKSSYASNFKIHCEVIECEIVEAERDLKILSHPIPHLTDRHPLSLEGM